MLVLLVLLAATASAAAGQQRRRRRGDEGRQGRACGRCSQQKADVNAPQVDGATALHWAVYRDDLELADLLIRAGANVNAANREGHDAAGDGVALRQPGDDRPAAQGRRRRRSSAGPNGETMVMLAARNGNPQAIKLLVAAGADVNARETLRGTTALMWAAEQRHPAAVKALLEVGRRPRRASPAGAGLPRNYMAPRVNTARRRASASAPARARPAAGRTYEEQLAFEQREGREARRSARSRGRRSAADGQPLANAAGTRRAAPGRPRRGAPRRAQPAGGGRGAPAPAQPAAGGGRPTETDDDTEVVVAGLVGSGGGGLTALIFAAREGDLESAKALLDAGADVNQTTEYGWTPLLTATNNRHYQLAQLPDRARRRTRTSPTRAAGRRSTSRPTTATSRAATIRCRSRTWITSSCIRLLLDNGADPNARGQGKHADAHHLHDAVVLRGRRHAVHPRRAVERHRADEAAARVRRRSEDRTDNGDTR